MQRKHAIYIKNSRSSSCWNRSGLTGVFLILLLLVSSADMTGQNRLLKKADEAYSEFNYNKALKRYQRVASKGDSRYHVTKRIADCYRQLNMPTHAVEWYEKAIAFHDVDAETYYHLGLALRTLKRYEESDVYLDRFHTIMRTHKPRQGLSAEDYLYHLRSDSGRFSVSHLNINSSYSEFGPALLDNKELVFSSNRPGKSYIRHLDTRNNQPFFDLYSAKVENATQLSFPHPFLPGIKTGLNDGPVSFTSDGQQMYITRNIDENPEGVSEMDVFVVRKREGKWQKTLSSLPLKIKGYSIAHPAISPDNERLYFSSDMPGGYGGMDLYYSERRGGFLSQPVNLGPHINTPGNEVFPFIDSKGRLFFASDGLPGLGGLDIFVVLAMAEGFSNPHNLGPGINSPYDDFSLIWNEANDGGYFASNRPGGMGEDDLYAFKAQSPLTFTQVKGTITNETTGQPEEDVSISVFKNEDIPVASFESDEDGFFSIHLLSDETYTVRFRKRMMQPIEKTITPDEMKAFGILNFSFDLAPR
ncbi:carboxypeptidase regulatory-like domain-containing protein [Geofilum rubicundum]|uniref:Outer membrane lipoprotein omp16 n=1 Tax=Geofilum rubicundum JCM 15548 TaxID=1236989 RepID=A0A0E9LY78_9BACT|nr:carboxypeptidase regulatory-like domain-containing protein [Geofilum rubicundum]GAO30209.1 outer membrane lipoprotein omp16 precursor [Geofilum rubicundum JCM 15548]